MTDHHDFGDHHDDYHHPGGEDHHDDPLAFDDPAYADHGHLDDPGHDDDPGHLDAGHYATAEHTEHTGEPTPTTHDLHIVDDHPDPDHAVTVTDGYDDPVDVFPPPVDVGDLPEPVDGFPWIDPATLGTPHLAGTAEQPPVDPHELAEYAGTELPEGTDPWTVLAASDDPATSTLARFWHDPT